MQLGKNRMSVKLPYKRPESVLIVIYTDAGSALLLKRRNHPNFWQSVTGSLAWDETADAAAVRELKEETGIDARGGLRELDLQFRFAILPEWRHRYAPDVHDNLERAYALRVTGEPIIQLCDEHTDYGWFDLDTAAAKVWSWTNRIALERVALEFTGR
jgi:dihydroneopterin triphosphate diphosphatase